MPPVLLAAMTGLLLVACGCAKVTHQTYVEPKNAAANIGGFVYYESSPYLLVYPDGKGGVSWDIHHFPDPTKKRVAKPEAFIAKLETTFVLTNGVLTQANAAGDETAFGKALVGAAKTFVGGLFNAADSPDKSPLRPQIYKIIVRGAVVEFWGAEADVPVAVPAPS